MVCLGNICRSPMAEGILRKKIEEHGLKITVDSAGTGGYQLGNHPDKRAIRTAKKFGVDISELIARKFSRKDFDDFDRIYVMDHANMRDVLALARTDEDAAKVFMLLNADEPESDREVPDPWYGVEDDFTEVFKMMEKACDAVVGELG